MGAVSLGARALAKVVRRHGARHVAKQVGASGSSVHAWSKGVRTPSGAARSALKTAFGIGIESWDETTDTGAAPTMAPAASVAPETPSGSPRTPNASPRPDRARRNGMAVRALGDSGPPPPLEDPKALAHRLVSRIETELSLAQGNADYSPRERATLATAGTTALRLYSRLAGSLETTQAALVRSAAWQRILRAFERVFSAHPEAAKALAEFVEALRELGE
jgi:hypothetical protein